MKALIVALDLMLTLTGVAYILGRDYPLYG